MEAAGEAADAGANLVVVTVGRRAGPSGRRVGRPRASPCPPTSPSPGPPSGPWPSRPWSSWRRSGSSPGPPRWVELAVDQLESPPRPAGPAREPGRGGWPGRIGRTIPLVHGAQALGAAAALRWKTQVNENAKSPAFAAVYPELCHNEIAGWGQNGDVTRQIMTLVNLRHDAEHPQVVRRFELVAEMSPGGGGRHHRGPGRGRGGPGPAPRPHPRGRLRLSPPGRPGRDRPRSRSPSWTRSSSVLRQA